MYRPGLVQSSVTVRDVTQNAIKVIR